MPALPTARRSNLSNDRNLVHHGSSTWLEHGEGGSDITPPLASQPTSPSTGATQSEVVVDDTVESPSDLTYINNNQICLKQPKQKGLQSTLHKMTMVQSRPHDTSSKKPQCPLNFNG